jgi:hypothetical protein
MHDGIAAAAPARPPHMAGSGAHQKVGSLPLPPRLLPTWWLFFQQAFWLPQFLGFALVPNVLLPMQVTAIAKSREEGHALAVALTLIMVSGFSMPLIGAWSDRCDGFLGIAGSRRPFILYGQLGVLVSIWMMMRAKTMFWLATGNFLFSALNNLPTTVYAAVLPELVPPSQRGRAGGFQMLMQFGGGLLGYAIGVYVGDDGSHGDGSGSGGGGGGGGISMDAAYWILIVVNALDIPLGMVGVGQRPGLWAPERPRPALPRSNEAAAAAPDQAVVQGRTGQLLRDAVLAAKTFVAPFWQRDGRAFRWFFAFTVLQQSAAQCGQQYVMYWLRDEIGGGTVQAGNGNGHDHCGIDDPNGDSTQPGFTVLGYSVASTAAGAVSILGLLMSITQAITSMVGGYSYFGKCMCTSCVWANCGSSPQLSEA